MQGRPVPSRLSKAKTWLVLTNCAADTHIIHQSMRGKTAGQALRAWASSRPNRQGSGAGRSRFASGALPCRRALATWPAHAPYGGGLVVGQGAGGPDSISQVSEV